MIGTSHQHVLSNNPITTLLKEGIKKLPDPAGSFFEIRHLYLPAGAAYLLPALIDFSEKDHGSGYQNTDQRHDHGYTTVPKTGKACCENYI